MRYLLSGNPKEVEKVIRENRIRVQRGVIEFTPLADAVPCDEPNAGDEKDAPEGDTKDAPEGDTKTPKVKRPKKAE